MTLNEVVFDIKEMFGAESSDDRSFDFSDEFVLFRYEKKRAGLIEQKYNSARGTNAILVQHLKVPVEQVDRSMCPSVPVGCTILRSVEKIPSIIWLHRGGFVTRVGSLDVGSKGYNYIDYSRVPYAYDGVVNFKKPVYAFIMSGYLYIISRKKAIDAVSNVALSAVFEEPSAIMIGGNCLQGCDTYPLSGSIHDICVQMVVKDLFTKVQMPDDPENDSNPTIPMASGGKK